MNVWEFLGKSDIGKIRFRQPEEFSPYSEWLSDEQLLQKSNVTLEYNCFYRYEEVFQSLIYADIPSQVRQYFIDVLLHYLMQMEFCLGITSEEYQIQYYRNMLERGEYGQNIKAAFELLCREQKHFVARSLYRQSQVLESKLLYAKVMTTLFDPCAVYESKLRKNELLVYMPRKCEGSKKQTAKMAEELFLPISYEVRIFNGRHPGILDEEETMQIDKIEIY